jgi:hypothetical protein
MKRAAWSDRRVRTSGNVSAEDVRAEDQDESAEDDTDDLRDAGKQLLSAQNRPPKWSAPLELDRIMQAVLTVYRAW